MNVPPTSTTPALNFREETRTLEISGESYPENSFEFYRPLLAWLDETLANDATLTVQMRVLYMNTSSVKCVMDMFDRLEEAHQGGGAVKVIWLHVRDDERARELGEEFKEDLTLPFTIQEEA